MIELTQADLENINLAVKNGLTQQQQDQAIYRAGMAAERARTIEECAKVCDDRRDVTCSCDKCDEDAWCARAIRLLNAPAAP